MGRASRPRATIIVARQAPRACRAPAHGAAAGAAGATAALRRGAILQCRCGAGRHRGAAPRGFRRVASIVFGTLSEERRSIARTGAGCCRHRFYLPLSRAIPVQRPAARAVAAGNHAGRVGWPVARRHRWQSQPRPYRFVWRETCWATSSTRVASSAVPGWSPNLGPVLGSLHPVAEYNVRRLREISGLDTVSFHMSGTEAVMQAVRLARYHTGRRKLVRFCGAYHGWWGEVQPGVGNPQTEPQTFTAFGHEAVVAARARNTQRHRLRAG